jgi:ribosome-binding factor A
MARPSASPETRSVRLLKVGEQVRHVISELLTRQQVHDDVLSAHTISVTEVRMSPDLRHASVFVKPLLGSDEDVVLKALRTHTAYFQKEVAGRLKLKYAAKIKFLGDESFDEATRIEMLLNDPRVKRDLAAEPDADSGTVGD